MTAVRAAGLRLRYGQRTALDGVSFEVSAGEVVGLLGPNGAGKTSTLSILATLRSADAGDAEIAGVSVRRDPARVRRLVGLVPQSLAVYPTLTALENLRCFAGILGLVGRAARDAAMRALDLVGLTERATDVVATFSGGMQRRLNLACALLHRPAVLLLDEPTVGVDPQSLERILETVRDQARGGTAVLYSTHRMDEAERLCDHVVLIDYGCVVAAGTPAELTGLADGGVQLAVVTREPLPDGWLAGVEGARAVSAAPLASDRGQRYEIAIDALPLAARVLERAAAEADVLELHVQRPDLRDVFLRLTGRDLRD
ncbi:MAG TPA: ABC transporter ATP-binding protein [Candidatus Binatia bacterium]|nr:ABC transporter ATP-binding protein [Candidatus Binatia bacterium]